MNLLENARERINRIDAEMAKLFTERMEAAKDVAIYKKENGMPIFDASREAQVIERNSARVEDDRLRSFYVEFLKYNMNLSKEYQRQLLGGMKVAFCGVRGAFAETAAKKIFDKSTTVSYASFGDAYRAVENGECDVAVLPIENSYEGDVAPVLDLMFFGSLYAKGVYELEVVQNLLVKPGTKIENIKEVVSHPQALGQCAKFIEDHGFKATEMSNTALAAKMVAESDRTDIAAIASEDAGALYGLTTAVPHINTSNTNVTRFVVLSRAKETPKESDKKFILYFTVKNESGCLGKALSIIGDYGFNLSALKSRPTKDIVWDYYFFAEGNGNINGDIGSLMIKKLADVCNSVKIVGSFETEVKLR
ncbi:MAG: chorismate mutase [Ruminococcaceae bacterium]|nr:chorismate mutase [Oscillospiraceae bacterium]